MTECDHEINKYLEDEDDYETKCIKCGHRVLIRQSYDRNCYIIEEISFEDLDGDGTTD